MNVKEYIASGILEEYALGVVSPQEKQEVECMSHIYPEIKEALLKAQSSVEGMAEKIATPPPPDLKQRIMAEIDQTEQEKPDKAIDNDPKVIPINKDKKSGFSKTPYIIGIASMLVILLCVSIFYILKINEQSNQIADLEKTSNEVISQNEKLQTQIAELQNEKIDIESNLAFLQDKTTEKIHLYGTPNQEDASVTIYWNKSTKDVFLSVDQLDIPPTDLQYQLWALIDGQPVDMGVFDLNAESNQMQLMAQVEEADAFAITLETKGGNPTPNLDQLVVLGEV